MKIKVEPGHCVRLTGRKYSSIRGGVYDLAKIGATERDLERVLKHEGVAALDDAKKTTPKAAAKGGD